MAFLKVILFIAGLGLAFVLLCELSIAYEWVRRKLNKPRIGFENFSARIIKEGDYVSIGGRVMRFSHITGAGETINPLAPPSNGNKSWGGDLAFHNTNGLGYHMYRSSSLKDCEFIYGKYGLKWAASEQWAAVAEKKIEEVKWK